MAKQATTITSNTATEDSFRVNIFNSLITTPHRELEKIAAFHADVMEKDPTFYGKLAVWHAKHGEIRDHNEVFVANLLTSSLPEHREAGFMMLLDLPAHQVSRVVGFMVSHLKAGSGFVTKSKSGKTSKGWHLPRQARKAVETYLKRLEYNDSQFDRVVIRNKTAIKGLYTGLHLKPSERAKDILFANNPPKDSLFFALKQISKEKNPDRQAELIVRNRIPYTIAVTVIKQMTPAVIAALINQMTAQELANNIKSLEKHGAYSNPEIKKLVTNKLSSAKSKVAAMKTSLAVSGDKEVNKALEKVATKSLKNKGVIKEPTAIFIDKSGSMQPALMLGKRLAAAFSAVMHNNNDLFVYVFDSGAQRITAKGAELADWETAFANIKVVGATSIGSPLQYMIRKKELVTRIFIITDEGENEPPYFVDKYGEYVKTMGVAPEVTIIRFGSSNQLEKQLKAAKIQSEVYKWTYGSGDYYAIPNIVAMATKGSQLDLVIDIMEMELPERPKDELGRLTPLRRLYDNKEANRLQDATA